MKMLLAFLLPVLATAQTTSFFTINRTASSTTGGGVPSAAADELLTEIETLANAELSNIEPGNYLKYSADSTVVSGKSTGSDYANNFKYFLIGAGVGVGANLGSSKASDLISGDTELDDANGAGLQTSLIAGINLGALPFSWGKNKIWGSDRFSVFFNFFKYEMDQDEFSADALSLGLKVRWLLMKPKKIVGYGMLTWEGLHAHLGFEKSSLELSASDTFSVTETDNSTGLVSGTITTNALINAEIDTTSIPLEISSAVRFLYLFTLYGGLGFDLNSGSASGSGSLTETDVVLSAPGVSSTYQAEAYLGQEQEPESKFQRYFVGMQFNIWKAKLLLQYDRVMGENTHGIGVGFRVAI